MRSFRKLQVAAFALLPLCMTLPTEADEIGSAITTASIQVLSATVKDKPIPGADVIFQKNGQNSVTTRTDAGGKAAIATNYGVDDNTVLMIIKTPGYSTLVVKCPCGGLTYALSETMTQLDGMRIVLTWGGHPNDLDAHLAVDDNRDRYHRRYHIWYEQKWTEFARLDVDSRNGYGPETITIDRRQNDASYLYAVHTFNDDWVGQQEPVPYSSLARVQVYVGDSLVRTYYFRPGRTDTLLYLFGINEQGEIFDINQSQAGVRQTNIRGEQAVQMAMYDKIQDFSLPKSANQPVVHDETTSGAFALGTPKADIARSLNLKGEAAYHRGDLEDAISLYHQALDSDPEYAQAYSNLGLAYQKSGRIPEALWANRRAIATADGTTRHVVRASSYYNIARIYEARNDLESAILNYRWAQQENPKQVYMDAIHRTSTARARKQRNRL